MEDGTSETTWHAAAKRGDLAEIKRLLDVDPELLRSRDGAGRTVLHHLAALPSSGASASEAVSLLLSRGLLPADLDVLNVGGLTPLQRAIMSDNRACCCEQGTFPSSESLLTRARLLSLQASLRCV